MPRPRAPDDALTAPSLQRGSARGRRHAAAVDELRRAIGEGRYAEGLLPPERDLAGALDVSRTTLRRALADLAAEGLVTQRQGLGTFVAPGPGSDRAEATEAGTGARSPAGSLAAEPARLRPVWVTRPANPEEALILGIGPKEMVLAMKRTDGSIPALETLAIPVRSLPPAVADAASISAVVAALGPSVARTLVRLRVGPLADTDARLLEASPGDVGVSMQAVHLTSEGRACALIGVLRRGDGFDGLLEAVPGSWLVDERA